jgi:RsiW-degrading membrane proteinase PrsW (M82 family)
MPSFFLIILGFVPSLVWLLYYLKKDLHPEPKSLIARTMFLGILAAPLAVGAELVFDKFLRTRSFFDPNVSSIYFFLAAAFIEEYVKYLVIKFAILHNVNFDEPTDAMIYMISAALGFAAIENIFYLFSALDNGTAAVIQTWFLRFAGATLLHAVSSALFGYFIGLSWFFWRHSKKLVGLGLACATLAHLVFNLSLSLGGTGKASLIYSSSALIILVILISYLFNRIKKRIVYSQFA